ncbi:kinase-like domain-containing protein [Halteromyces radiatus]|uniref:kinase-like domain-containing protein n=1 Tax=Halteromyces radiatus TaxID=101107 RepID=UPI00221FAA7A|nr:kinase-like domain-containing protein [Halteromyces radiatus]KAI8089463.1 kinase-like domain-containing protein [Halteromyces radiatus]
MASFFSNFVNTVNSAIDTYIKPSSDIFIVNKQTLKKIKLLAEGGFSQVYLTQDENQQYFVLKRIPCKLGKEQLRHAQREVQLQRLFQHKNIVPLKNAAIVKEEDGSKVVYMVMPYYKRGTLQDILEAYHASGQHFKERQIYRLFLDISQALSILHTHTGPGIPMTKGDERQQEEGQGVAWSHRDIKPGNILISDTGKPLLMDFGSAYPARVKITTKQEAAKHQDMVEEQSSMPYRSPELMQVKVDSELTEKTDIFSLGCSVFTMAYGGSPFETYINKQGGGSLALAVLNGQFSFPTTPTYSDDLKNLISWMLTVDPQDRPSIQQVITRLDSLLRVIKE